MLVRTNIDLVYDLVNRHLKTIPSSRDRGLCIPPLVTLVDGKQKEFSGWAAPVEHRVLPARKRHEQQTKKPMITDWSLS